VVLVLLFAACGDDDEVWTDVRTLPWNRAFVTEGPPPVRIGFTDDALTAQAECNTLSGPARIDDGVLVVDELAMTEMGCDAERQAYDEFLATFLTSRPTIALDGETLTLTAGADTLVLTDREVADPDRPLVGTDWVVDGIVSGDAVSSVPQGAEARMRFTELRVDGNGGCNDFGGDLTIEGDTIRIGDLVTTDMACADDVMALEASVFATLTGDVIYEIDASTLRLTGPDGHGLMLRAED
jgi:heat shock protein HslJ